MEIDPWMHSWHCCTRSLPVGAIGSSRPGDSCNKSAGTAPSSDSFSPSGHLTVGGTPCFVSFYWLLAYWSHMILQCHLQILFIGSRNSLSMSIFLPSLIVKIENFFILVPGSRLPWPYSTMTLSSYYNRPSHYFLSR